jgi:hypothetical protein
MKFCIALVILVGAFFKSYSQSERDFKDHLIAFFVSGFNGDSVRVVLNGNIIMEVRLKSTPVLDQCDTNLAIKLTDTVQTLTIYEVERKKSFQTVIKRDYQYLYISRLSDKDFDFDYSNRLRLPE